MKTLIEVTNNQGTIEMISLNDLRERNCKRRMRLLSNEGLSKAVRREVTVHTTDKSRTQLCCHYSSFALRQMNREEAVRIFNADGSQIAKIK